MGSLLKLKLDGGVGFLCYLHSSCESSSTIGKQVFLAWWGEAYEGKKNALLVMTYFQAILGQDYHRQTLMLNRG